MMTESTGLDNRDRILAYANRISTSEEGFRFAPLLCDR